MKPPSGDIYYQLTGRRNWVEGIVFADDAEGWAGPFDPWKHKEFSAPDQPVVCISFSEAESYATWLTSETEIHQRFYVTPHKLWDIAAFGRNYQVHDCQQWQQAKIHHMALTLKSVSDAEDRTTPFGAIDMIGNVWEWCSSGERTAGAARRTEDLEIRGGGYLDDLSLVLPFCPVSTIQDRAECRQADLGFRIATTVPLENLPCEVAERVRGGFDLTPGPERPEPSMIVTIRMCPPTGR
jgi:formylglycine-generating enzyme required for sulfatase activity